MKMAAASFAALSLVALFSLDGVLGNVEIQGKMLYEAAVSACQAKGGKLLEEPHQFPVVLQPYGRLVVWGPITTDYAGGPTFVAAAGDLFEFKVPMQIGTKVIPLLYDAYRSDLVYATDTNKCLRYIQDVTAVSGIGPANCNVALKSVCVT